MNSTHTISTRILNLLPAWHLSPIFFTEISDVTSSHVVSAYWKMIFITDIHICRMMIFITENRHPADIVPLSRYHPAQGDVIPPKEQHCPSQPDIENIHRNASVLVHACLQTSSM